MLPFKRSIGINSTYGADLSGTFTLPNLQNLSNAEQQNESSRETEPSLSYDKIRQFDDIVRELQPIKSTFTVHNKGMAPKMRDVSSHQPDTTDLNLLMDSFVTGNENMNDQLRKRMRLKKITERSDFHSGINVMDPTRGRSVEPFYLIDFETNEKRWFIATRLEDGNTFGIGLLDPKWIGWKLAADREQVMNERFEHNFNCGLSDTEIRQEEYESESVEDDIETKLSSPHIEWLHLIDTNTEVFQLSVSLSNDQMVGWLMIRTKFDVKIMRLKYKNEKLLIKKSFDFKHNDNMSYIAESYFDIDDEGGKRLLIIDINAKFSIFHSPEPDSTLFRKWHVPFDSFYEPTELSNFKKGMWLSSTRLLFMSRSQIHEFDMEQQLMVCRVTGGTWSVFLDIKPITSRPGWLVLLTSKELIIVDATTNFRRRLGWKHFLNHMDKSLTLQVLDTPYGTESNQSILCKIQSRYVNCNTIIKIDPFKLKIIDYPHWMFTHKKVIDCSIALPLSTHGNLYLFFQLTNFNEFSTFLVKYTSFFNNSKKYGRPCITRVVTPEYFKYGQSKNEFFFSNISTPETATELFNLSFKKFVDSLHENPHDTKMQIQSYADDLSVAIEEFVNKHQSVTELSQLAKFKGVTTDQFEMNEMLQLLIDHYKKLKSYSFTVNNDTWKSGQRAVFNKPISADISATTSKCINELIPKTNKNFPYRDQLLKTIEMQLNLSHVSISKEDASEEIENVTSYIEKNSKYLDENLKEMLDTFETDMNIEGFIEESDIEDDGGELSRLLKGGLYALTSSQAAGQKLIPTVSISQSKPFKKHKKPTKSIAGFGSKKRSRDSQSQMDDHTISSSQNLISLSSQTQMSSFSQQTQTQTKRLLSSQPMMSLGGSQRRVKAPTKKKKKGGF